MVIRCVEIFAPPLVSPGCAIVAVDMVGDVCAACEVAMQSLVLGLALKSCAGMGKDGGPEVVPVSPPAAASTAANVALDASMFPKWRAIIWLVIHLQKALSTASLKPYCFIIIF